MPSTKCEGLNYPIHFFESRDSVNRNYFLEYRTHKPHFLQDKMISIHCSLQIKQKTYSTGIFCAPVVTQCIVKV